MKRFIAGVAVGMVLAGGAAHARSVLTGQEFNSWPSESRTAFAAGWHVGFLIASASVERVPPLIRRISTCIDKWTFGQVKAVIDNYLRDNPQQWHESIDIISLRAAAKACP